MAASQLSESDAVYEIGEYQQFPRYDPKDEAAKTTQKPQLRHLSLVLLGLGLLCVLQAILNITLRLAAAPGGEGGSCPEGWLAFSSSCYHVSAQRRNWDGSRRYCRQRGADLVVIDSRQEQAFLTGFTEVAWVGMTDRRVEGVWMWVDGTPVNKDSLQWARGQPDDAYGGEDCGDLNTMTDFIGLNDRNCSVRIQWICEKTLG